MRNLKFDLTVDSSALLCPNPNEFYAKAYITEDIANNYRVLPGIKSATKIATTSFSSVLKASDCSFVAGDQTLSAITVDVVAQSALAELCRFDLEQSYLSLAMSKGSGASFEVQPFMSFYWNELASEIEQEISNQRWQGNTATASFTGATAYLKLVDGYEKLLASDAAVIDITATTITSSNVLVEMDKVYVALLAASPAVIQKTNDLRFYVSASVGAAFRLAVAAGNTQAYVTKNQELSYLDIKVVIEPSMTSGRMALGLKSDFGYAFDGEGDSKSLKAINLEDSVAEPLLRTRVNIKTGFFITNPNQIAFYS